MDNAHAFLDIALRASIATAAALAWAIARGTWSPRWPFYRSTAALLTWLFAADSARWCLQYYILRPARAALGDEPYPWPERLAWFADLALQLSWSFAILAACLVVYLRRRPWPALAGWLGAVAILSALYPGLRGLPLLHVEAGIATACWLACAWAGWRSVRAGDVWLASHMALVPILGAQAAVLVAVAWGADPVGDHPIARLLQGVGYVLLLAYQVKQIRKYRVLSG